jgi:hypothetical protein
VIPSSYVGYFQTASQAAGTLIGLLFVVIALRPGRIVGAQADPVARGLAASSFTGLVDAFFVSLLALIPGNNVAVGAAILAVLCLYHTLRLHLGHPGAKRIVIFVFSLLAYGFQLVLAVLFALHPHDSGIVNALAFVIVGAFAVALSRAWQLLQSSAVAAAGENDLAGTSGDDAEPNSTADRPTSSTSTRDNDDLGRR